MVGRRCAQEKAKEAKQGTVDKKDSVIIVVGYE
jgi:hypothetical protein